MPENVFQQTWVIDLDGAPLSKQVILSYKDMFNELVSSEFNWKCRILLQQGGYYVERMGTVLVINTQLFMGIC